MNMGVYYDKNSLYGECEGNFQFEQHDLVQKYRIKIPFGRIFHVYECKNCNVEIVFIFFNGGMSYVYTSFPHFMWKSFPCGKKIEASEISDKLSSATLKRILREFKAGLYSGYPLCCIVYFTFISNMIPNRTLYKELIYFTRRNLDMSGSGSTHINCPMCNFFGSKNIGKYDPPGTNCLNVSLHKAIISAFKWRLMKKELKEAYNKEILTQRVTK